MAVRETVPAPNKDLRINLVVLRARRGLSQTMLAEMTGVSRAVISELEGGRGDVRLGTLARLASGLDVSVADLLQPWRPSPVTDNELTRRAREDDFIDAETLLSAMDEADRVPRYSRRGRRPMGKQPKKRRAS